MRSTVRKIEIEATAANIEIAVRIKSLYSLKLEAKVKARLYKDQHNIRDFNHWNKESEALLSSSPFPSINQTLQFLRNLKIK